MRIVLQTPHWRHRQTTALICFTDDDTLYDPWVEKLVGVDTSGDDVWLYARKMRNGFFTCMAVARNYAGGSILYERNRLTSLGAACRDVERWFTEQVQP